MLLGELIMTERFDYNEALKAIQRHFSELLGSAEIKMLMGSGQSE